MSAHVSALFLHVSSVVIDARSNHERFICRDTSERTDAANGSFYLLFVKRTTAPKLSHQIYETNSSIVSVLNALTAMYT